MEDALLLGLALFAVIQGAQIASHYSEKIAEGFHLSRYIVGFIIVSFISILPETFIAVDAALRGDASFSLSTLLGSNVADLTIIFSVLTFIAGRHGIRVEKSITHKLLVYPLFLIIPLLVGLDGHYSRAEGAALVIVGLIFYFFVFKKSVGASSHSEETKHRRRNLLMLLIGMGVLLAGAHFTVSASLAMAKDLGISSALIGILVVALGTTIPELFFSARAIKNCKPALAIGDVLGSVLADATIVIGIVALISPFAFPQKIIFIAGTWMVGASIILLYYMRSRFRLSYREGILLIIVWLTYLITEIVFS